MTTESNIPLREADESQPAPSDLLTDDLAAVEEANALEIVANNILRGGHHLVVLVGDTQSGKSSTIASLASISQFDVKVRFELDESVFPTDTNAGQILLRNATIVFKGLIDNWLNKQATERTDFFAYFLPFKIRVGEGSSWVKLVFFDAQGEYQRRQDMPKVNLLATRPLAIPPRDPPFPPILNYLLGIETKSISLLLHARADRAQIAVISTSSSATYDTTIASRLNAYKAARIGTPRDRLLLLLTQWDRALDNGIVNAEFETPSIDRINESLRLYPATLSEVRNVDCKSKSLLQYSSGHFDAEGRYAQVEKSDPRHVVLARYRKTLLNWLYEGAGVEPPFPGLLPDKPQAPDSPVRAAIRRISLI
jgi:hypothetical protein